MIASAEFRAPPQSTRRVGTGSDSDADIVASWSFPVVGRIIGWAMGEAMPTKLPLAALRMALRRYPAPGLVHHTDRGSQYTAEAY